MHPLRLCISTLYYIKVFTYYIHYITTYYRRVIRKYIIIERCDNRSLKNIAKCFSQIFALKFVTNLFLNVNDDIEKILQCDLKFSR